MSTLAHRVTYATRYVDGMEDPTSPVATLNDIDDHTTHDVHYINSMFDNVTISLSVLNFTDEDPPQVANDLNYDPYNHSGYGRIVKLGSELRDTIVVLKEHKEAAPSRVRLFLPCAKPRVIVDYSFLPISPCAACARPACLPP
ncbi:MAG: hypothetical protein ACNYPE_08670 [Candidatus Azotimanducaceae bacterium WSBS_2022_MAG_OTU7]